MTLAAGLVLALAAGGAWYYFAHRGLDWAVIVVAGDWHAHNGGPTEAFDNARRDVSAELRRVGFAADNMAQFSVRPNRYPDAHALPADTQDIENEMSDLTNRATGGCLLYFSSHGSPWGIVLGNGILAPNTLAQIVDQDCGDRPSVIIISACYSGVFVPALEGPNRVVITAARLDRTSFGCGQDNKYPYFDDCVVQNLPDAGGFLRLADKVRDCVSEMETQTGANPPSEPQVSIGTQVASDLPGW